MKGFYVTIVKSRTDHIWVKFWWNTDCRTEKEYDASNPVELLTMAMTVAEWVKDS